MYVANISEKGLQFILTDINNESTIWELLSSALVLEKCWITYRDSWTAENFV